MNDLNLLTLLGFNKLPYTCHSSINITVITKIFHVYSLCSIGAIHFVYSHLRIAITEGNERIGVLPKNTLTHMERLKIELEIFDKHHHGVITMNSKFSQSKPHLFTKK